MEVIKTETLYHVGEPCIVGPKHSWALLSDPDGRKRIVYCTICPAWFYNPNIKDAQQLQNIAKYPSGVEFIAAKLTMGN